MDARPTVSAGGEPNRTHGPAAAAAAVHLLLLVVAECCYYYYDHLAIIRLGLLMNSATHVKHGIIMFVYGKCHTVVSDRLLLLSSGGGGGGGAL